MKLRRTIILIAWLGICLIAGYVTTLACKPIYLTQDEVRYYTEIANIVWYEGENNLPEEDAKQFNIYVSKETNMVKLVPQNTYSQSITVDFSSSEEISIVNKPTSSYILSFLSYGFFFGSIIFIVIYLCLSMYVYTTFRYV